MTKDRWIALIVAALISVGSGFIMKNIVGERNAKISEDSTKVVAKNNSDNNKNAKVIEKIVSKPVVKVLVAKNDIHKNDYLTNEKVKWDVWPKENVSADYIAQDETGKYLHPSLTLESIVGLSAKNDISKNSPVTVSLFFKKTDVKKKSIVVKDGMRAISVPVDSTSIKNNVFEPGDIVDIFFDNKTKHINNVKILAFDSETENSDKNHEEKTSTKVPQTVTIEVAADKVNYILENLHGGVFLVMVGEGDQKKNAENPSSIEESKTEEAKTENSSENDDKDGEKNNSEDQNPKVMEENSGHDEQKNQGDGEKNLGAMKENEPEVQNEMPHQNDPMPEPRGNEEPAPSNMNHEEQNQQKDEVKSEDKPNDEKQEEEKNDSEEKQEETVPEGMILVIKGSEASYKSVADLIKSDGGNGGGGRGGY